MLWPSLWSSPSLLDVWTKAAFSFKTPASIERPIFCPHKAALRLPKHSFCPASPNPPPDVQIRLPFKGRLWEWPLIPGSCRAVGLSKPAERGIVRRQPWRKGLNNESVHEILSLASVIDERFIEASSLTWGERSQSVLLFIWCGIKAQWYSFRTASTSIKVVPLCSWPCPVKLESTLTNIWAFRFLQKQNVFP